MDPLPERPRGRFSPVVRAAEAAFWAAQGAAARAWTQAFTATPAPRGDPARPLVALLVDGPPDGVPSSGRGTISPGSRFRALQLVPAFLERAGLEVRLLPGDPAKSPAPDAPWPVGAAQAAVDLLRQERGRYEDLLRCADADVVYAMRELQDASWSRLDGLLHLAHDRIVLDMDDAIWTAQDAAEDDLLVRKWRGLVRGATTVVASTPVVAERAREDGAARVELLPTAVDLERYRPPSALAPRDLPVVGWLGTSGNLGYLRRIAPALERVAASTPFELRVMCDPVEGWPALTGAPSRLVPWTPGGDVEFQGLDVGLMPLDDTEWCRGKAAFKLVQYMACGVAVVASPVGFNVDVVGADGARGLLAGDEAAWVEALGRLLRDPGLRSRLGAAGRAHVAARFGAAEVGARLATILRGAAAAPGFGGLRRERARSRVLRWAPTLDADDGPRARAAALASDDVEVVLVGPLVADLPARERLEGGLVVVRLGAPAAPYLRPDPIGRAAGAFVRRHARAFDRLELDGDGPGAQAAAEAARAAGLPRGR